MKKLLIIPFALSLTACAPHLTQEQCMNMNWKQEGFQDAKSGKMPRELKGAIQDCQKFELTVDTAKYQQGWQLGARRFCRPGRSVGLLDGEAGKPLNAIYAREPLCRFAGYTLSLSQYKAGRYQGLKKYCTYQNGSNLAQQGLDLPDVCPKSLRKAFYHGWSKTKNKYCHSNANAFALGKEGKPYPAICPANLFVSFKSEYDRGQLIYKQVRSGKARIQRLDDSIRNNVYHFHLEQRSDGYYKLSRDTSPQAQKALSDVNRMVTEKRNVERDVFEMKIKR